MFRLRISFFELDNGDGIRATVKSRNMTKICAVYRGKWYINNDKELNDEFTYQLSKACREAIRDELLMRHGKHWRKFEQQSQILKSTNSAIKRMQLTKPR